MNARMRAVSGACLDGIGLVVFGSVMRPAHTPVTLSATGSRRTLEIPHYRVPAPPARYYSPGSVPEDNLLYDFLAVMPAVLRLEHLRQVTVEIAVGGTPIHRAGAFPAWRRMRGTPYGGRPESLLAAYAHLRRRLAAMRRLMKAEAHAEAIAFLTAFWVGFKRAYARRGEATSDLDINHCFVGPGGALLAFGHHRTDLAAIAFQAIDATQTETLESSPSEHSSRREEAVVAEYSYPPRTSICLFGPSAMLRETDDLFVLGTTANGTALCQRLRPHAHPTAYTLLRSAIRLAACRRPARSWRAMDPLIRFAASCAWHSRARGPAKPTVRSAAPYLLEVILQPTVGRLPEFALFAFSCALARHFADRVRFGLLVPAGEATANVHRLRDALEAACAPLHVYAFSGVDRRAGLAAALAETPTSGTVVLAEGCIPALDVNNRPDGNVLPWITELLRRDSEAERITLLVDRRNRRFPMTDSGKTVLVNSELHATWLRSARTDGQFRFGLHVPAVSALRHHLAMADAVAFPGMVVEAIGRLLSEGSSPPIAIPTVRFDLIGLSDQHGMELSSPEALLALVDHIARSAPLATVHAPKAQPSPVPAAAGTAVPR